MANPGLAIVVIMILLAANHSTATYSAMKSNSTTSFLQGNNINASSMHEHYRLVEDDVVDVEFFLDSELASATATVAVNTLNGIHQVIDCGRDKPYKSCLPDPQNSKIGQRCGVYTRGCH